MIAFPYNLYVAGGIGAFAISFLSLPFFRRLCARLGMMDDPGHRKIHSAPIPLAGGWAVLLGISIPLVLGALAISLGFIPMETMRYGLSRRASELLTILLSAVAMTVLGAIDDKYELRPSLKFTGQFLIAFATAAAGIRITLFVPSLAFSYLITILWILTITNALNFLDNMNGLCAGLGLIGAWSCAWTAALQGQYLVALLAFTAAGALLGFLPYNYPNATAFLGDAGSHLIGYLLSVLSILPHFYTKTQPNTWAVLSPLLILFIPLLDITQVVLHRLRAGKPIYLGDTNHLSHRLVRQGYSKPTAVALILLASAITSTWALLLLQ